MKQRMPFPRPSTIETMQEAIRVEWDKITLDDIQKEIHHVMTVCQEVFEAEGQNIHE